MSYMLKLILVNVFVCSVSSYDIELVAKPNVVRLIDDAPPPSFYVGDVFAFKVNVYDSKLKPTKIWCTKDGIYILDAELNKKRLYYTSENITATTQMNGYWSCRAFFHKSSEINFSLKVTVSIEQYYDAEDSGLQNIQTGNKENEKIIDKNADKYYINCSLRMSQGKPFHDTSFLLYENHNFTLNVKIGPGVIQRGLFTWIKCYNKDRTTEIFVTEPLLLISVEPSNSHHYTTVKKLAVGTMEATWQCWLSNEQMSPLDFSFPVRLEKFGGNSVSTTRQPIINNDRIINRVTPAIDTQQNHQVSTRHPFGNIDEDTDNRAQSPAVSTTSQPAAIDTHQNEPVASDDQILIRFFKDSRDKNSINTEVPSLSVGQKTNIVVEDRENILQFTNILCHYVDNTYITFLKSTLRRQQKLYRFESEVVELTKEMSVKWKCLVYDTSSKKRDVVFEVELKDTDTAYMHVWVNEYQMNLKSNNLHNGRYFDSKLEYYFYEGELAKIKCEIVNSNNIQAKLIAQNGTQILKTEPHSTPTHETIYLKLTKDYHVSYIDCTVTNVHPQTRNTTVRLLFKNKDIPDSDDKPIFNVNGLSLVPNINNEFSYSYYSGETLAILGYTQNPRNSWHCNSTPEKKLKQLVNQTERINLTVTSDFTMMLPSIDCKVGANVAALNLKLFQPYNPIINGLSMSQTLMAYQQNQNTYKMIYKNKEDSMKLVCTSDKTGCKWNYNDSEVDAKSDNFNFTKDRNQYISTLHLSNYSVVNLVINCTCPKNADYKYLRTFSVVIINELREKSIDTGDVANTMGQTALTQGSTLDTQSTPAENDGDNGDKSPPKEILIGIVIGTVLIVILVIWLIVGLHKRKRKREQAQASDINYENLPEHNEGPMRTPAQWNQYTEQGPTEETYTYCVPYVEKNVEEMYAQPQSKSQRQPDTMYAEVGAMEPTYAAVGQETPTFYANTKEDPTPAYSQIQPKSLRGNTGTAPQVLPKPVNQNYAQVLPKSVRNAQYENVIKNDRYVNAENKEYAEPAYCEVAKK